MSWKEPQGPRWIGKSVAVKREGGENGLEQADGERETQQLGRGKGENAVMVP